MAGSHGILPVRLYFGQNHLKARWFERKTARSCDLLTAITDEDATLFRTTARGVPSIVLSPGYSGARLAERQISAGTPRAVVLFGSYRWSAKQTNLRILLDRADPIMCICLDQI